MSIFLSDIDLHPSYKSFDSFVDVDRLIGLDGYLQSKIESRAAVMSDDLFVNAHCLDAEAPYQPGVREVWLKRTLPGTPYNYLDINATDLWHETPEADEFAELMTFIETLP